jgi:hypothetical protein
VRFDLNNALGDRSGSILTFQIVSTANRDRTFQVWGLADNATDDAWDETTTSYNTAPGVIPTPPTPIAQVDIDESKMTLLGTVGMIGSGAQVVRSDNGEPDSMLNLDNFLAADTNGLVTFLIINSASDTTASYSIASKENTTPDIVLPTLELPNAVPEPAAVSSLGMGALVMLGHRRRRV